MTSGNYDESTGKYTPPAFGGFTPDIYGAASPTPYAPLQTARQPAKFTVRKTSNPKVYAWRCELRTGNAGLNLQEGEFDIAHDRLASSQLVSRFPGYLTLPLQWSHDNAPVPTGNLLLTSAYVFDKFAVGCGAGANVALSVETSATNPTLSARTYSPGAAITSLTPVIFGSTQYLAVGRDGSAAQFMTDLGTTPTIAGTNATLTQLWGAIPTNLNNSTILFYNASNIYTLNRANAYSDTPQLALSNIGSYGWALGLLALGGSTAPVRAWWVNSTRLGNVISPGNYFGSENSTYQVVSTDLNGQNMFPLNAINQNLHGLTQACFWRDGIVATDGDNIVFTNGRVIEDLHIFSNRPANSDKLYKCRGFHVAGPQLIAEISLIASPSGTGNTQHWLEYYDPDLKAWSAETASFTNTTTGVQGVLAGGSGGTLPWSPITGYTHRWNEAYWWSKYVTPYGTNPAMLRKTAGASSGSGVVYENTANSPTGAFTATWPLMQIPGLEGWEIVLRRIEGFPDVDSGGTTGTPCTIQVSVAGTASDNSPAVFKTGYTRGFQYQSYTNDRSVIHAIQPSITINPQTGGTDPTRFTPNALPIVISGLAKMPDWDDGAKFGAWTR